MKKQQKPKRYTLNFSLFKDFKKNKKGVLGVSLDSLGSWIQGIMSVIPAPLKFLIFLFLLITLGYVLSIIFNAFGIFCNSANQPVQLNANLFSSIALIGQIPDPEDLGKEALGMEEAGYTIVSEQVNKCSFDILEGYYITETGERVDFTDRSFYDGTFCTDCDKIKIYNMEAESGGNRVGGLGKTYCEDDAVRNEDKNLAQKLLCGNIACEPPQHYYYDSYQNLYLCADESCSGITLGQTWDELLASKGARLFYPDEPDTQNPSSDNAFGITCTDLKPKLAFYGIDLFTYSIWIVILLIIILLWGLNEIRK